MLPFSNTLDPRLSEDEEEELDLIQARRPRISAKKESLQNRHESFFVGALIFLPPKKTGVSSSSEAETGQFRGFLRRFLVLQIHTAGETYMFCCVS